MQYKESSRKFEYVRKWTGTRTLASIANDLKVSLDTARFYQRIIVNMDSNSREMMRKGVNFYNIMLYQRNVGMIPLLRRHKSFVRLFYECRGRVLLTEIKDILKRIEAK